MEKPSNGFSVSPSKVILKRSAADMIARHVCSQWVVGFALGHLSINTGLIAGLEWFDRESVYLPAIRSLNDAAVTLALNHLREVAEPAALSDLLPYILDPHGPGSRLSVMRDPSTKTARAIRRVHGVFYTPADVAEYMVQAAFADANVDLEELRVFDPACGTGVFLRAALCTLHAMGFDAQYASQHCLFGVDIDPWSVDGAAYVLLHDVLSMSENQAIEPASLWRAIRSNLAVADALSIDPADAPSRLGLFELRSERLRFSLADVFPSMGRAPNVIIGNPPYAAITGRRDLAELAHVFTTFPMKGLGAGDMHPLFFEQMVRLAGQSASGALVIPLAIAFSGGQQYFAMRQLIEQTSGTWKFSFFDREPHALFGEDVKTRNTIITWSRTANDRTSRKMTGPLLKWRGHDRARMLRDIRHTELHSSIANGIPKLSSNLQSETLDRLIAQNCTMSDLVKCFYSTSLEHTFAADPKTLFVGGTAYNFLNVLFRPPARLQPQTGIMSTNTMHALTFSTVKDAFAAFALLSSGVSFWLWHIQGDGFHLSKNFLENFPIGPNLFDAKTFERLSRAGLELWHDLQSHPVESMNRGKVSLSFPATRLRKQQRITDGIIIKAARLPSGFLDELDHFIMSVISALPSTEAPTEVFEEVLAI
ncbi:MAG TPA: N-6 DNA methylase [Acidobacteriaceae bacterium]|nr:N-6 DNA methylase [Acidobacteriaceae bacterium]